MTGRMAEWSNAPVLKTGDLRGSGSSNLSPSAKRNLNRTYRFRFFLFEIDKAIFV